MSAGRGAKSSAHNLNTFSASARARNAAKRSIKRVEELSLPRHIKPSSPEGKIFRRVLSLMPSGIINALDVDTLTAYAVAMAKVQQIDNYLLNQDVLLDESHAKTSRLVKIRGDFWKIAISCGDRLGLSPRGRAAIAKALSDAGDIGDDADGDFRGLLGGDP